MEVRIFKGEKFACEKCPKSFSSKQNRKKHFDSRHRMSIEQFLDALAETPRMWSLNREGRLSFNSEDVCPLSAVAGLLLDGTPESEAFDYQSADRLGISRSNAVKIIRAADSDTIGGGHLKRRNNSSLRNQLLEACGIFDEENES